MKPGQACAHTKCIKKSLRKMINFEHFGLWFAFISIQEPKMALKYIE